MGAFKKQAISMIEKAIEKLSPVSAEKYDALYSYLSRELLDNGPVAFSKKYLSRSRSLR